MHCNIYRWNLNAWVMSACWIFVRQIHGSKFPLPITHLHQVSTVVIIWCSPEVWLWNHFDHFHAAVTVRSQTTIQMRKQYVKVFTANTKVVSGIDYFEFGWFCCFYWSFYFIYALTKCNFMSFISPYSVFFQQERNRYCTNC